MSLLHVFCSGLLLAAIAACAPDSRESSAQGAGSTERGGAAAESDASARVAADAGPRADYDFDQPDMVAELHRDMKEISGLTVLPSGHLGAIQDEDGIVFVLDRETGDIVERRPFAGGADYEGIEQVDERVFILRSDGTLIELSGWSSRAMESREIETHLSERNDPEGLAFDQDGNRLLIACKERPGAGLGKDVKAVYAFDLGTNELLPEPVYTLDVDEIDRQSRGSFKPSALAVEPSSGMLYVLSSTTKTIAVLAHDGSLERVVELPRDLFEQPEALVFSSDGTLYIASEGDRGSGILAAYSARASN